MSIEEASKARKELERQIRAAIDAFTDAHPDLLLRAVSIDMIDASTHSRDKWVCGEVRAEVQL